MKTEKVLSRLAHAGIATVIVAAEALLFHLSSLHALA